MASEAQKRATAKYVKENVKQKVVRFYPADAELYEEVKDMSNFGQYVKELIRRDKGIK